MNELQFRKQCIIDPNTPDAEFQQALENAENRQLQEQCIEFDNKLADALNVAVPDGLAQRIIERNRAQKTDRSRGFSWNNWRPSLAAAASVAATMVFAIALLLRPQVALSEMIIDHLDDDIDALHDRTVVTDAELLHVL
jgi:anti-sigma-K factor RskA